MNLQELKNSDRILYQVVVGSHLYNLNNENSDIDIKGFFWVPHEEYLSLDPPVTPQYGQIDDEKHDETYYSLYRAFELLKEANPNMIELLFVPEKFVLQKNKPIMDILLDNRHLFITQRAYFSHARYAQNQIKKAKGKNKKVHNPQPERQPLKEDFCRVILMDNLKINDSIFPFRPLPLSKTNINLEECHVASLEHAPNVYRLYHYGKQAKGVFRGSDMLVCESIPKEDEWKNIIGLLIYDKNEFDKSLRDWHSYWDWIKHRNESRWIDQEKGLLNYDQKNMCHCLRLMMESENILIHKEPKAYFEGEEKDFLLMVRRGELTYEEIMEKVDELEKRLENLFSKTDLPETYDREKIDILYKEIMRLGASTFD